MLGSLIRSSRFKLLFLPAVGTSTYFSGVILHCSYHKSMTYLQQKSHSTTITRVLARSTFFSTGIQASKHR